jgi:hypothetical protein
MWKVRHVVGRESFWLSLAAAGFVASVALQAQPTAPGDHSAYFGGWTLSRELSSTSRPPEGTDGRGREGGRPGGRGGRGGRFGGGGGFGAPGGAGEPGGPPSFDPKEMEIAMALMQELMTPTSHWILRSADASQYSHTFPRDTWRGAIQSSDIF